MCKPCHLVAPRSVAVEHIGSIILEEHTVVSMLDAVQSPVC
jgi:hypothetical protein